MPIFDPNLPFPASLASDPTLALILDRWLSIISQIESRAGENNLPRFEPAYMPKGFQVTVQGRILTGTGTAFTKTAEERWNRFSPGGICTSASFGPWQILYQTAADRGFAGHPSELWVPAASKVFVIHQVEFLQNRGGKKTLADLAEAWNAGPGGKSAEYRAKFLALWQEKPPT